MASLEYEILTDVGGSDLHEAELHAEVEAAGPYSVSFVGVGVTGAYVKLFFDGDPSGDDQTTLAAVVLAHDHDLVFAKKDKDKAIDEKTDELIAAGFTFASKQFSLSLPAQIKMTAAHQIKGNPGFVYPVVWNSIDDTATHTINNSSEMDDFYIAAVDEIRAHLDSGTALKDSVRAATTVAEVDAVVDNR